VDRVKFVKSAQRMGFSLDQVAHLLKLEDGTHCNEAAELAASRLVNVRERLRDLTHMERALSRLVEQCCSHHGNISCPLIAALHGD
jgi:MerR family mercuric resistance operon transcriptional regulator